jgi:NADH-quinone oxidoreductase subunit C
MINDIFTGLDLLLDSRPEPQKCGICRMVIIDPGILMPVARRLLEDGYHLEDVSGLDAAEGFLVTYHFDRFDSWDRTARIAVRALASHENAHLPSIAGIFDGAEWHERELHDFFGVNFEGNPNPAALLLPEMDDSTPLCKAPDKRRPLKDLIQVQGVVYQAPRFDWFDADPQTQSDET